MKAARYALQPFATGLTAFDPGDPKERYQAVSATLNLSLRHLSEKDRDRFAELAIFEDDVSIPLVTLQHLWGTTGKLGRHQVVQLCKRLWNLSLLVRYDSSQDIVRLHDMMVAYLNERHVRSLREWHAILLDSYQLASWVNLPMHDHYMWRHLGHHLVGAERGEELAGLLLNYQWLETKLIATDVGSILRDADRLPNDRDVRLVRKALGLSAYALSFDAGQLWAQLYGRLLADPFAPS